MRYELSAPNWPAFSRPQVAAFECPVTPIVSRKVHDERATDLRRNPIRLHQDIHIEEVTRVLTIQRRTEFPSVEIGRRQRADANVEPESLLCCAYQITIQRWIHASAEDRVGFDLDRGLWCLDGRPNDLAVAVMLADSHPPRSI